MIKVTEVVGEVKRVIEFDNYEDFKRYEDSNIGTVGDKDFNFSDFDGALSEAIRDRSGEQDGDHQE